VKVYFGDTAGVLITGIAQLITPVKSGRSSGFFTRFDANQTYYLSCSDKTIVSTTNSTVYWQRTFKL
jgi:hypothetical protein